MQVDVEVVPRHQHGLDIVRDGPGQAAQRLADEGAVQVALVDRRDPQPASAAGKFSIGRMVSRPFTSLASSCRSRVERIDLALVLVAVVAGGEQHAGAVAVDDLADRHRQPAVGRAVHGVRQAQVAQLLAGLVEVDLATDGDLGHAGSAAPPVPLGGANPSSKRPACQWGWQAGGPQPGDARPCRTVLSPLSCSWRSSTRPAIAPEPLPSESEGISCQKTDDKIFEMNRICFYRCGEDEVQVTSRGRSLPGRIQR